VIAACLAKAAEGSDGGDSLTTEYPANGSFFRPHTLQCA